PRVRRPPEQQRRTAQPETEKHNQTHDNQKEAKKFNIVEIKFLKNPTQISPTRILKVFLDNLNKRVFIIFIKNNN
ncbi:MAG: hypothetical protein ACTSUQ_05120, partial [Candidatus Freyarchaeota archaeon]